MGVEVYLHAFLTIAPDDGTWSALSYALGERDLETLIFPKKLPTQFYSGTR
jgi:hypothetical protein